MVLTYGFIGKINYTLKDNSGCILEYKKEIEFLFGVDDTLSEALSYIENMKIGEIRSFIVPKEVAFGDINSELIVTIPKKHIDNFDKHQIGGYLLATEDSTDELSGIIIDKNDEYIVVDFNHPFAGKEIYYKVELLSIRRATDYEIDGKIKIFKNR